MSKTEFYFGGVGVGLMIGAAPPLQCIGLVIALASVASSTIRARRARSAGVEVREVEG